MPKAIWLLQQLVPPALLTYFVTCWRICAFEIGPAYIGRKLGYPILGTLYSGSATISIAPLVTLFLRLYFLPRNQSLPPFNPPPEILRREVIYECLSPVEEAAVIAAELASSSLTSASDSPDLPVPPQHRAHGLVNRCYKGRCAGRWKPARARHCGTCGTCRAGFDHHCAIFANCLTVPYIPTFLCMLVLAPPTIFLLSSPLLLPLARRASIAWDVAFDDQAIRQWWWDWKPSWIIAGGPIGRWMGGLILGWKVLDRADGGAEVRARNAVLVVVGGMISGVCMGLAATTIQLVRAGQLTIDRERARSHARALHAISELRAKGRHIPKEMEEQMERYAARTWFYVPGASEGEGKVMSTLPHERPYDMNEGNWEIVMGKGWGWLWPWRALSMGASLDLICQWPIRRDVSRRLETERDDTA